MALGEILSFPVSSLPNIKMHDIVSLFIGKDVIMPNIAIFYLWQQNNSFIPWQSQKAIKSLIFAGSLWALLQRRMQASYICVGLVQEYGYTYTKFFPDSFQFFSSSWKISISLGQCLTFWLHIAVYLGIEIFTFFKKNRTKGKRFYLKNKRISHVVLSRGSALCCLHSSLLDNILARIDFVFLPPQDFKMHFESKKETE